MEKPDSDAVSFEELKKKGDELLDFLQEYQWIYGPARVAFYLAGVWEAFPSSWKPILKQFSALDLYTLHLSPSLHTLETSPHISKIKQSPSLYNFLSEIRRLPLIRLPSYISTSDHIEPTPTSFIESQFSQEFPKAFGYRVPSKKLHEIYHMSKYVHNICQETQANVIIDIGAGEGYISQILSQFYGYTVIGLEGNEEFSHLGVNRNQKVSQLLVNSQSTSGFDFTHKKEPIFIVHHLTELDTGKILEQKIKSSLIQNDNKIDLENIRYCIIGLHTCGDLAWRTIDLFINLLPKSVALVDVGCCYHRSESDKTFPKSTSLRNWKSSTFEKKNPTDLLGPGGLKLATGEYQLPLSNFDSWNRGIQMLWLRSVLQVALFQFYADEDQNIKKLIFNRNNFEAGVDDQNIKKHQQFLIDNYSNLYFEEKFRIKGRIRGKTQHEFCENIEAYLRNVMKNLMVKGEDGKTWEKVKGGPFSCFGEGGKLEEKEKCVKELLSIFEDFKDKKDELVAWDGMLVGLSNVLESVLSIDRLLYVKEKLKEKFGETESEKWRSDLRPIFDPLVSPRNMVLISFCPK